MAVSQTCPFSHLVTFVLKRSGGTNISSAGRAWGLQSGKIDTGLKSNSDSFPHRDIIEDDCSVQCEVKISMVVARRKSSVVPVAFV